MYAPSHGEQPEFHEKLFEILNTVDHDHVIMAGDWNHGLDTSMDYAGYTGSIPRPRQRDKLLQCIANHGPSDIFREQHPKKIEFTWRKSGKHSTQSRLDFFLVAQIKQTLSQAIWELQTAEGTSNPETGVNKKPKKIKTVWYGFRGILKLSGRVNQESLKLSAGFPNTVCWSS